jgi:hypothetical protein
MAKEAAPLGFPQQFSFHQQLIYLCAQARHKYQCQAAQPLHRIDNHATPRKVVY